MGISPPFLYFSFSWQNYSVNRFWLAFSYNTYDRMFWARIFTHWLFGSFWIDWQLVLPCFIYFPLLWRVYSQGFFKHFIFSYLKIKIFVLWRNGFCEMFKTWHFGYSTFPSGMQKVQFPEKRNLKTMVRLHIATLSWDFSISI